MLIVAREGGRRCKLPPHQPAFVALAYLREHYPDRVHLDGTLSEPAAQTRPRRMTAHAPLTTPT